MLVALSFVFGGAGLLYCFSHYSAEIPKIYGKIGSELYTRAQKHLRFLKRPYRPAWWVQNGLLMTVARSFRKIPELPWKREIVEFPDGGIAAIDWLEPDDAKDDTHILIIIPGITGHTHEAPYAVHPAQEAVKQSWRVLITNHRGLGGVPLKTPRSYSGAYYDDLAFILENIVAKRFPAARKVACGFSMGGMVLWLYLSTRTKETANLDAGMCVSSPFDPWEATKSLKENLVAKHTINRAIAQSLINMIQPHREVLEKHLPPATTWDHVCSSKTIDEFDERFTAPMGGFRDLEHYFENACLRPRVHMIPIPFLVLASTDDYCAPIQSVPMDEISKSENVICVVTAHGGHTAFMESTSIHERGFAERVLFQWSKMILNDLK